MEGYVMYRHILVIHLSIKESCLIERIIGFFVNNFLDYLGAKNKSLAND